MSCGGKLEKLPPFMSTGEFMCICMCVVVQYFCILCKIYACTVYNLCQVHEHIMYVCTYVQ